MAIERILVTGVIEVLKKMVIPVAVQKVGCTWSLKDDLKKLQDTLEMILAKIADAEEKQEKNNELRLWLKRLKDVAYDADDVMDYFSYETMRRSERESLKHKARDFVSTSNPLAYRRKLTKKIKEINKRVDEIAKDMERFQLQTTWNNTSIGHGESSEQRSRQTASVIIHSEVVGREDDKNKIVDILTKETTSSSSSDINYHSLEKVSVFSMVGMGGLGKTTLAQLVYNEGLVIEYFDQRIWVCVSTDFDVESILIKIMESITLAKFANVSNFDLLVNKVQEKLQGKKFLLVLDDLWNDNFQQWERLKGPLLIGAQGSKILVTTRNMQVAELVKGSIRPYQLGKLLEDECWSIMEKRAFYPGGAAKTPNMTDIGKEIAKKCNGLPLAAKFLGSLMHIKNKESDWLWISETGIWNTHEGQSQIRPILKLSYDNLSPHLKQCFSYCSIFPKGWEIKRDTLIHLWMAEGLLETSSNVGNARSVEDIGVEYFDSLVWSSFLDGVETNDVDDIITCKMHDLVHDLGREVVGNHESAFVKISEIENASGIRHLHLISDDELSTSRSKALSELKTLRTVIILEPANYDNMKDYTFSSNKKLRVLHYSRSADGGCYMVDNKLKHLRYLHLSNFNLLNGFLHDHSISNLYNLQTLVLRNCGLVQYLLEDMGSLKNLRFLDISSSDIRELPDSVTSLCNLRKLDLSRCTSLTTFPNSATGLKHLTFLDMSFTPVDELPGFIINLCNLQTLDVSACWKLKSLPEYIAGLANLRILDFSFCHLLEALPIDIGALTKLRFLSLVDTQIKVLPDSFANLSNLEILNLFKCELPKDVQHLPKLRKFMYREPRNQIMVGVGKQVSLEQLIYSVPENQADEPECNVGIEELGNLNLLEVLSILNLQYVKDPRDAEKANLKGKQNLWLLFLSWGKVEDVWDLDWWDQTSCNALQVFEALQPPASLKRLNILNFMGCDLPTWMRVPSGLPYLERMALKHCYGIEQLPAAIGQLPRLRILTLKKLPLKSLDIGGFHSLRLLKLKEMVFLEELCDSYPCLRVLQITGCTSLTEIASFPFLISLELKEVDPTLLWSVGRRQTSLVYLYVNNIEDLIYFPIRILQNNCNLQYLSIRECNQLECFGVNDDDEYDIEGDLYSGSLQILGFYDCPDLKFLPDLRGWTSLQRLTIWNCPQVKEFLTYDLKSLPFLEGLFVDFIQRDEQRGDPSDLKDLINILD